MRRALAFAGADELRESGIARYKLHYLDNHAADYDLVFIGSSRMFRQIAPDVFDAELGARGRPISSYNLGLPGMWFYEVLYRASRVARRAPGNLRWIVIELQDPDPDPERLNQNSKRTIAWHTPRFTWIASRTALGSERPLVERLTQVGEHLVQGLRNGLNAGFVASSFEPVRVPAEFRAHRELRRSGFMPLDYDPQEVDRRQELLRSLEADPDFLRARVERFRAALPVEPPPALFADLTWLVGELRGLGVEPIFVLLPPSSRARTEILAAHAQGVLPNLIDLEDPETFPEFYLDPDLRFDAHHLNRAGAERLTRELARAALPILAADGGSSPERP